MYMYMYVFMNIYIYNYVYIYICVCVRVIIHICIQYVCVIPHVYKNNPLPTDTVVSSKDLAKSARQSCCACCSSVETSKTQSERCKKFRGLLIFL